MPIGRVVSLILFLPAFVLWSPNESFSPGPAAVNAQGLFRNLIARLRGETMPDGIVRANGLIEAAKADVSSRYPGRITEISVKEGAQVTIGQALARVSSPEADVILVSPRDGEVQDLSAETGDAVAAGESIAMVVDSTDLNLTVFLSAADAGRLAVGDEARVILDAAPNYVIPAVVSFVASDIQVSPKAIETKNERAKQTFRVDLRIDPQVVKTYGGKVEAGLAGAGVVRTKPDVKWPAELQIKLPPAPVAQEAAPAPARVAEEQKPAPAAPSPVAQAPAPPAPQAPAPPPVAQEPTSAPEPAPLVEAPKPGSAPAQAPAAVAEATTPAHRTVAEATTPAPRTVAEATTPAPGAVAKATTPAPAPPEQEAPASTPNAKEPTPAPGPASEASTASPVEQDLVVEIAPQSVMQLVGAWAPSAADCEKAFQRKGRALTYRHPADPFTKAVIVEPQRIRLPSLTCQLESATRDGGSLKLIAECADTISYTSRTVYVKLRSKDELVYSPTGDPVLATNLTKCPN